VLLLRAMGRESDARALAGVGLFADVPPVRWSRRYHRRYPHADRNGPMPRPTGSPHPPARVR